MEFFTSSSLNSQNIKQKKNKKKRKGKERNPQLINDFFSFLMNDPLPYFHFDGFKYDVIFCRKGICRLKLFMQNISQKSDM